MPPPTGREIAEAVGLAIPSFFGDAFDQAVQGEGGYIANGMPKGAIAQIGQAVARSACRRYGSGEAGVTGGQAARYERACRPYLDTLQPSDGIGLADPFQGGQCSTSYTVEVRGTADITDCGSGVVTSFPGLFNASAGILGPISNLRLERTVPGACGPTRSEVRGTDGNGTPFAFPGLNGSAPGSTVSYSGVTFTLFRDDGAADNCGNPEPVTVPVPDIPDPLPPPFRFNPIPGIDVGVDVTVGPGGDITFDVGTGPITLDPFADGDGGGGGGTPGDATDPGTPGPGGDTGNGGAADGAAPDGQELVGVLVQILQSPENPNVFSNNVAQVFRGVGYVRMGYANRLGADISAGTVISPQFFHAQQRGLTNYAVSANTGFNLRTTPYYRSIE